MIGRPDDDDFPDELATLVESLVIERLPCQRTGEHWAVYCQPFPTADAGRFDVLIQIEPGTMRRTAPVEGWRLSLCQEDGDTPASERVADHRGQVFFRGLEAAARYRLRVIR